MTEVRTSRITRDVIENAYTYEEYRQLIHDLLEEGKTTGENHSEGMLHYTNMNVHRMNRIDKRIPLNEELAGRLARADRSMIWLIITEGWCGDAAQALPIIQKMADQTKKIHARYILRDKNLEIMDQFLTNGKTRSIPKLIALDSTTLDLLGTWGPRPHGAQTLFGELRGRDDISSRLAAEMLHKWYADDKTTGLQNEFVSLLDEWENA